MAPSPRLQLVVLGTVASQPYAGVAWMTFQIAEGLRRLGHEVFYFETTSAWPYDPVRGSPVCDTGYAVPHLTQVAEWFGFRGRWAYRSSYSDKGWVGMGRAQAEALLRDADAVFNVSGATRLAEEQLSVGRLVYLGTDPVIHEVAYANGDPSVRALVQEHDDVVTYGENLGRPGCPVPPLPRLRARTRQPILLDRWRPGQPHRGIFTTVGNWKQSGYDVVFQGETYTWSKHHELLKFLDLPARSRETFELATGFSNLDDASRRLLLERGWQLVDAHSFTQTPQPYQEYIESSGGEFTVAKDQNVRLRTAWFSERSACYLASGRPVVTQDTGFGDVLPTGEGLFAFQTLDDILGAVEAIRTDYARHARAARSLAEEFFGAERVLSRLLEDLGL